MAASSTVRFPPRMLGRLTPVVLLALLSGCGRHAAPPPAASAPPPATTDPDVLAALVGHPLLSIAASPPESGMVALGRHDIYYVRGGTLTSIRAKTRDPVSVLVRQAGGVAGLNGTFFSDARVAGRGNKMIGPLLTGVDNVFAPVDPADAPRCVGRPLVVLSAKQAAIVPYALWMGVSADEVHRILPGATDAFLAGGWLVHNGVPATEEEIRATCVHDAMDFRRRAFVGMDHSGRLVLGASDYSIDSAHLARSLPKLGIREAVLLDSGFSTSLVWQGRILVSGHSRRNMPSRPVPHALVLRSPDAVPPAEKPL